MDIIEAIKERRSVRSYDGLALKPDQREALMSYAREIYNPFGGHFTIRLKEFDLRGGFRPSTYGMIRGASDFFMLGIDDDETSALAAGFCFEHVVLRAWQLGLGTCWIAATFKGTDFTTGEPWPEGERLRIVCPVGTPARKSIMERIARFAVGSRNRKPYGELFFTDGFNTPLPADNRFARALEMLRLAPSSTNSQPWRASVEAHTVHFFYVAKSALSVLDCGIGLCHFSEAERYYGQCGRFYKTTVPPASRSGWRYLISYKAE